MAINSVSSVASTVAFASGGYTLHKGYKSVYTSVDQTSTVDHKYSIELNNENSTDRTVNDDGKIYANYRFASSSAVVPTVGGSQGSSAVQVHGHRFSGEVMCDNGLVVTGALTSSGLITASADVTLAANQDLTMSGTGDITGVADVNCDTVTASGNIGCVDINCSGDLGGASLTVVGGASNVGALTCSDLLTANFGMSITGSALNMGDQDIINCGTISCDSIFLVANEDVIL